MITQLLPIFFDDEILILVIIHQDTNTVPWSLFFGESSCIPLSFSDHQIRSHNFYICILVSSWFEQKH